MFTKTHVEGLAVTSFTSLSLRTHPRLTFCMRSRWHLYLLCFFENNLGKQNARRL